MSGIEKTLIRQINDLADGSCLNLGLGELRFPTPASILDHVRSHCYDWKLGYTPNEGLGELRELVASTCGFEASPENVCVTAGAQEALFAAVMILVQEGDEVLIPDPGFAAYPSIVRMAGGTPLPYPLPAKNAFRPDVKEIESLISPRCKILIVNSPHNPTGTVLGEKEIRELAELCREREIFVLSDEVYSGIVYVEEAVSPARYTDLCVVVNSVSKTYAMTGWRLGWAIAPTEIVKPLAAFHQLSVTCAPAISQHAAAFALKGGADQERTANFEELKRRRGVILDSLGKIEGLSYHAPAGAFYVMADTSSRVPSGRSSLETAKLFLSEEKVVTIPGSAFGALGEGSLRLSFAAPPGEIEEGVRRLARFLG
jgi:aspartate/methionine/tyrosine aminotransferase